MEDKLHQEVSEVIDIIEQIYEVWMISLKNRLANFKRINLESFVELVRYEQENGRIKNKRDIIQYIENITQD